MAPPTLWQLLSGLYWKQNNLFCVLFTRPLHTDDLAVCCAIFLMREILLFQSEQGWTHPIPTHTVFI